MKDYNGGWWMVDGASGRSAIILIPLLQESFVEGAALQRSARLDEAVDLGLAVRLAELEVHGHVVAAGGDATQERHGVIQDLLLVRPRLLRVNDRLLCIANLALKIGLLRLEA